MIHLSAAQISASFHPGPGHILTSHASGCEPIHHIRAGLNNLPSSPGAALQGCAAPARRDGSWKFLAGEG
jgi:hypothetical protein